MSQHIAVVGAGPAGEAAARTLRQQKSASDLEISLIEKEWAGGLCLNKGCIPSKTLLEQVRHALHSGQPLDWSKIQAFKTRVVTGIRTQLESNLKRMNIRLLSGHAQFESPRSLTLQHNGDQHTLSFDKAILTTGTDILFPPPLDQHKDHLLTSDTVLDLTETPASIAIVGGGAVGLELACLLNAAGSQVTVIELTQAILPGEDPAVVSALTRSFESRGIEIKTGTRVQTLEKTSTGWNLTLTNGDTLTPQQLMACVGRVPNPGAFLPEKGEIQVNKNRLVLNESLQTTNPDVFAAGDGTALTRLAHAAAVQGEVAAFNALGHKKTYDDRAVPRCLYSWPEVASVGQWKYKLEEDGRAVKASRAFYRGSAKALAADETEGFVQVVSDPHTKTILGAQILGAHATELIHIFSVALKANLTTDQLGEVMFAHPTLSEMIKEACLK